MQRWCRAGEVPADDSYWLVALPHDVPGAEVPMADDRVVARAARAHRPGRARQGREAGTGVVVVTQQLGEVPQPCSSTTLTQPADPESPLMKVRTSRPSPSNPRGRGAWAKLTSSRCRHQRRLAASLAGKWPPMGNCSWPPTGCLGGPLTDTERRGRCRRPLPAIPDQLYGGLAPTRRRAVAWSCGDGFLSTDEQGLAVAFNNAVDSRFV